MTVMNAPPKHAPDRTPLEERPPLPGKVLAEHYLAPLGITVTELADAAGLARQHLSKIINGRARITAETAVRLGRVLGVDPCRWLDLQEAVDLYDAEHRIPPAAVRQLANDSPNAETRPAARAEGGRAERVSLTRLEELLADPNAPGSGQPRHTPAEAVARIFELRKGKSLPDDMTLKELIALGRD